MTHPGVPITPASQNRILTEAWRELKADPKLKDVIIRSWSTTNLYPLVDTMPGEHGGIEVEGALPAGGGEGGAVAQRGVGTVGPEAADVVAFPSIGPGTKTSSTSRMQINSRCSMRFCTDDKDYDRLQGNLAEVEGTRVVEAFDVHERPGTVGYRYKVARPGEEQYALLVSSLSSQFHEKSYVLPARELQTELQKDRLNKGTKLPNVAGLCLKNPDTTTGLCVAEAQLKIMFDI